MWDLTCQGAGVEALAADAGGLGGAVEVGRAAHLHAHAGSAAVAEEARRAGTVNLLFK